ncbi:MAG: acyltransferase family protein [Janthinobacterium lividum]
MTLTASQEQPLKAVRPRDVSLDYLRTALTLLVVAHHSSLAYTTWASFNPQVPLLSTAPIVDGARWVGFDYLENFNDVFFMSLMFFISGLFVYPVLRRQGSLGFIHDRLLRLGLPFVVAVVGLMPLAYFASWQLVGRPEDFITYYRALAAQGFMVGPPWFIWVLLLFDVVAAGLLLPLRWLLPAAERLARYSRTHALATATLVLLLATAVYWPLLAHYGPTAWTVLVTPPFAFQVSRIGLYFLWFGLGVWVGVPGLSGGLLAPDGSLARHWLGWVAGSLLAYNALWFAPSLTWVQHLPVATQSFANALLWVASCVASCFGGLALFRGLRLTPNAWMDSLSRSAYILYLVHYVFLTWLQLLATRLAWSAPAKFGFVFLATTFLSWLTAQGLIKIQASSAWRYVQSFGQ